MPVDLYRGLYEHGRRSVGGCGCVGSCRGSVTCSISRSGGGGNGCFSVLIFLELNGNDGPLACSACCSFLYSVAGAVGVVPHSELMNAYLSARLRKTELVRQKALPGGVLVAGLPLGNENLASRRAKKTPLKLLDDETLTWFCLSD